MRNAECGLQIAVTVKYRITVYLNEDNYCGRPMFSPCRTFDNPVAKCSTLGSSPQRHLFCAVSTDRPFQIRIPRSGYHVSGKRALALYQGIMCKELEKPNGRVYIARITNATAVSFITEGRDMLMCWLLIQSDLFYHMYLPGT